MEEMISIMEELQAYVPQREDEKFLALGGDQLTVRNARIAQRTRCTSPDPTERLEGITPFALDWHAECNLLQVCGCITSLKIAAPCEVYIVMSIDTCAVTSYERNTIPLLEFFYR